VQPSGQTFKVAAVSAGAHITNESARLIVSNSLVCFILESAYTKFAPVARQLQFGPQDRCRISAISVQRPPQPEQMKHRLPRSRRTQNHKVRAFSSISCR